jgi:hypothetical protein
MAQNICLQMGKPAKEAKEQEKRQKKDLDENENPKKASAKVKKSRGEDPKEDRSGKKISAQKDRKTRPRQKKRPKHDSEDSEEEVLSKEDFSDTEKEAIGSVSGDSKSSEEEFVKRAKIKPLKILESRHRPQSKDLPKNKRLRDAEHTITKVAQPVKPLPL